jgi:heptosyltransferase-2
MIPIARETIRHLIVRTPNWLGDTVMALPALRTLRSGLPQARITLVGSWVGLLAGQSVADGCVAYPRAWGGRVRALGRIRALGADAALLLPNSFESALAAWLWGAGRRIGYATDRRSRLLTHPLRLSPERRHQVEEYLALLAIFSLEPAEREPTWELERNPANSRRLDSLLASAGLGGKKPLVGVHLGAAFGPSKLWLDERFARLGDALHAEGISAVLLGSPEETARATRIQARAGSSVASLVGRDSPELLPELLSRLDLFVSGDTGAAHLAAALGVPVVTLFGPTDPRLTRPLGAASVAIWKQPSCAPCFLTRCPIDHVCMHSITVEEVLGKIQQGLSRKVP